ncbi:MAG: hypothetical protein ACW98I_11305 [Candidatus Hodarchaeales archaeon]|jgi:hypothetical protein
MVKEIIQDEKEWKIKGYSDQIIKKLDMKLMEDQFSYWFRYRSIPWYRKRRIKGINPRELLKSVLKDLHLDGNIRRVKYTSHTSYYWVIESKTDI